jgi:hypothetical protein
MSEDKTATLTARIIHSDKKEVLGTVERVLSFLRESDEEQIETKTLDEIISEFIQRIEEVCKEKKVSVLDPERVYDELAIGFAVSSKLAREKAPKMTIDILVADVKENEEKREHEQK